MPRAAWVGLLVVCGILGLYLFPPLKEVYDSIWDTFIAPLNPPEFLSATVGKPFIFILTIAFFIGIVYSIFHKKDTGESGGGQGK